MVSRTRCLSLCFLSSALLVPTAASAVSVSFQENFNAGLPGNGTLFGGASAIVAPLTVDNYDAPGTPFTASGTVAPAITAGGPTGNFLRLTTATNSLQNQVGYNVTAPITATRMVVDFDFRATPGGGQADGIGMALLNVANFGASGAAPAISESPNLAGSFGVGIDIHAGGATAVEPNNNHLSFHSNSAQIGNAQTPGFDMSNGVFHHANVVLNWTAATTALATITLTPDIHGTPGAPQVFTQAITGLSPYQARVAFGARTGGQNAAQDIDNVRVDFGPIEQGGLQLTSGAGNQLGGFAFSDPTNGRDITEWTADFDFRNRAEIGGGADGFSLSFVRGNDVGAAGEAGRPTGLTIGFDNYDNGAGDVSVSAIDIFFDGVNLTGGGIDLLPLGILLDDGNIHNASISMDEGLLDVTIDGQVVLNDFAVAGWTPYSGRFNFGARTGGESANHYIDNFSATLTFIPEPATAALGLMSLAGLAMRRRRLA